MIEAVGHIVGALIASFAFGLLTIWLGAWDLNRNQKNAQDELALSLGVPVDRLNDESLVGRAIDIQRTRFSPDLLQNRVSDLAGMVRTGWSVLGLLLQVGVVILTCWLLYENGMGSAPFAWMLPAIAVLFWISSLIFSLACKLLTGRYPGQAKMARKELAKVIKLRDGEHAMAPGGENWQ